MAIYKTPDANFSIPVLAQFPLHELRTSAQASGSIPHRRYSRVGDTKRPSIDLWTN